MSNPKDLKRYNGICYAHGHLVEPVTAQGGCPSVGCSGETCDSIVMDFDDPMVFADDYDRDIKALNATVTRQNEEIALLRGQAADRDEAEQSKTIERLEWLYNFSARSAAGRCGLSLSAFQEYVENEVDGRIAALKEK